MTVKKFCLICNQEAVADATIVKAVACCDAFQWLPVRWQCWTDTQPGYLDEQDDDAFLWDEKDLQFWDFQIQYSGQP